MKKKVARVGLLIAGSIGLIGVGFLIAKFVPQKIEEARREERSVYLKFNDEIYSTIKENYWEKISDEDLGKMYVLAMEKMTGLAQGGQIKSKEDIDELINESLKSIKEDKKREYMVGLADMVLANLKPFGRSRLYALKDEKALSNTVNNINPEADHFKVLEVDKDATDKEIEAAFEQKEKDLVVKAKESTEAAQRLADAKEAYKVLKDEDSRKIYEVSGIEPTIEYKLLNPEVFYLHLTKFSPTSLDEFQRTAAKVDSGDTLDSLILDLRGNIGGAIDSLPYFLGPFIGADQYAYQFFHQGETEDYKTRTGWLPALIRYKKVVVLTDENSQSSAEVMAAVLKRYNVGVLLGNTTRGWGTVEKVFPIKTQMDEAEKYSVFLVHSVTLRDDNQPIEGRGVEPHISISSPNWKKELMARFGSQALVKAVEEVYKEN